MSGIYNYLLTSKLLGRWIYHQEVEPCTPQEDSFHLFSSLPVEIRRKIWQHALPSRLIEASLDIQDGQWGLCYTSPTADKVDRRKLLGPFTASIESREVCLEQYLLFANSYIHPKLDLLYISWQNADLVFPRPKFYPIQNQPLSKLHTIGMTVQRNTRSQTRFALFASCLRHLGTPQEILLCLVGPKLPSLFSPTSGFSISNGNLVVLLDWANKVEENMSQEVRSHVMRALEAESATAPGFSIPELNKRLYYVFSGP